VDSGGTDDLFAYHCMLPTDIAQAALEVIAMKKAVGHHPTTAGNL
jgi:hypothetical protein